MAGTPLKHGPDSAAAEILAFMAQQRAPMIEFIRELVELESPSSESDSQSPVRAVLAAQLEDLGYHTVRIRGGQTGDHLYARPRHRPRGGDAQLLIGHYDTVWPTGTLSERPFEVEGSVIRGPGVFDMKGGLAQLVFALKAIITLGRKAELVPVILVNGDEEIGSRSSGRFIHQLARRVQRAFILEPSMGPAGSLKTTRKGVGRFTVTVHGRASHAGLDPEAGVSAILEMSHVIQALFAMNDPGAGISVNVGKIDGGMRPNVIAPLSRAVVDVRVPDAESAVRIERQIFAIQPTTDGIKVEIEGGMGRPALEATPGNRALWEQARALGLRFGLELTEGAAGGGSDGNTTSLYTPTLDGLGAVGDGAHAVHEYLDINMTMQRAALLAGLLLEPAMPARKLQRSP